MTLKKLIDMASIYSGKVGPKQLNRLLIVDILNSVMAEYGYQAKYKTDKITVVTDSNETVVLPGDVIEVSTVIDSNNLNISQITDIYKHFLNQSGS